MEVTSEPRGPSEQAPPQPRALAAGHRAGSQADYAGSPVRQDSAQPCLQCAMPPIFMSHKRQITDTSSRAAAIGDAGMRWRRCDNSQVNAATPAACPYRRQSWLSSARDPARPAPAAARSPPDARWHAAMRHPDGRSPSSRNTAAYQIQPFTAGDSAAVPSPRRGGRCRPEVRRTCAHHLPQCPGAQSRPIAPAGSPSCLHAHRKCPIPSRPRAP
jgi:hypothetical protein